MVRTAVSATACAVLGAALLTGCSSPELQTTSTDVDRTFAAARDPWAAPVTLTFPTQPYGGRGVMREAGSRRSHYPGLEARQVARLEVEAAESQGWTLASVACAGTRTSTLVLTKGSRVDDAVLAELAVRDDQVEVSLVVPHHLDGSWGATTPVSLEETCVAGGLVDEEPTKLPFDPYAGDDGQPPLEDFEPWQRDTINDDERAFRAAVMEDPLVSSLGVDLRVVHMRSGDNWRQGGSVVGSVRGAGETARDSVAATVGEMAGWRLTWASCGEGLPVSASLLREFDGRLVTARISASSPDPVEVTLGLPIPEVPSLDGYLEDVPTLTDSRCLAEKTTDDVGGPGDPGAGLVLEGVPVALPGELHPYLGD